MTELDTLIPTPVELTIAGEVLAVKPLKVGQMPAFLRAIGPVVQQLAAPEIDWLQLFGERGHDLLSAIAIAVGKPRTWVDELGADDAIRLAAQVIEVNADFFTRAVLPQLETLFARAQALAPRAVDGPAPSPHPGPGSTSSSG